MRGYFMKMYALDYHFQKDDGIPKEVFIRKKARVWQHLFGWFSRYKDKTGKVHFYKRDGLFAYWMGEEKHLKEGIRRLGSSSYIIPESLMDDVKKFFEQNKEYVSCQVHELVGDIEKISGYREKRFWGGWW